MSSLPSRIAIPLRLQPSNPPTQAEITSRQEAWCEWVWAPDQFKSKAKIPPSAIPQWKNNGDKIPTEGQIYNLLCKYVRKMDPANISLIADNPDLKGYKVRKFSSGRFNVDYLLIKERPGRADIPGENAEPIREDGPPTHEKFWPALNTKPSSYDRLIRVKMPWAPYYAVENEVSNMLFASRNSTKVRVPTVYCFDSSGKNNLSLDFIVMERIGGLSGSDVIKPTAGIPTRPKDKERRIMRSVMRQFEGGTNGLRRRDFDRIGSLYCKWDTATETASEQPLNFFVGPLVDPVFFGPTLSRKNIQSSIESMSDEGVGIEPLKDLKFTRGPFNDLKTYLNALINARLLRDWSQCKPSDCSESPDSEPRTLRMTKASLAIALAEATAFRKEIDKLVGMVNNKDISIVTWFSLPDLRPGGMVLTEKVQVDNPKSPEANTVKATDSKKDKTWYRLKAVTEWDTARVIPALLSECPEARTKGHKSSKSTSTVSTTTSSSSSSAQSGKNLDGASDKQWSPANHDNDESGRQVRKLAGEIGWLCAVEMPMPKSAPLPTPTPVPAPAPTTVPIPMGDLSYPGFTFTTDWIPRWIG